MRTMRLLALSGCAAIIASTIAAPSAMAAALNNYFETPAAGSTYTLSKWAADGWNAPWHQGLDTRTYVDSSVKRSGGKSLRVTYPAGKFGPADSGAQAPFAIPRAQQYYVAQWVRFSPDFSWGNTNFAGKVGVGLGAGASCSGGIPCDGYNGFTSRFIWRSGGKAAIYYYSMDHAGQYGDYRDLSLDGKPVYYPPGQWVEIVKRVKVNTVTNGNANPDGEIQVWFNGRSAALITGIKFVRNGDLIDRAYLSSFAGGGDATFAPTRTGYIWYDDLRVNTSPI
ncbi:polysaccharide lyase [Lentzea sp. JNUCC 0626]|uniref:polysaccharide lyase n=1 Tax=Lentzea sp. JNUCC 0626 TaxID=3367513 RepID=UPI003749A496